MRRLNVKLLVILVVSSVVFLLGAYVVHAFQVGRTAGALLVQAEKRTEEGDLLEAEKLYRRYLHQDPENFEVQKKRALVYTDYASRPDATGRERNSAGLLLEQALRNNPDDIDLRRRTANFTFRHMGRPNDALEHYEYLIKADPDDAESYVNWGMALAFDNQPKEARKKLEECIETHPDYINAYVALAQVLHRPEVNDTEAAAALMDKMVEKNPDDPRAYVERSRYQMQFEGQHADAATLAAIDADVAHAVELDPDGEDTLLYAAQYEASRHVLSKESDPDGAAEHLQRAHDYATHATEVHPESTQAMGFLARLATYSGDIETADEELKKAIKEAPLDPSLLLQRADIYMAQNDPVRLRRTIADMRRAGVRSDQVDLYEARALMLQGQWKNASILLERIRPRLTRTLSTPEQIDLLLGSCYLNLGQSDRALTSFKSARELVRDGDAKRRMTVEQTLAASLIQAGKTDEGIEMYRRVAKASPTAKRALVTALLQKMKRQPANLRDWSEIEGLLKSLDDDGDDSVSVRMSRVEMLSDQGKTEEAFAALDAARAAYPDDVSVWAAMAVFQARYATPDEGLKVVAEARKKLPQDDPAINAALLNTEIRITLLLPTDDTLARLPDLEKRVSSLEEAYQPKLLELLGQAYGSKGDNDAMTRLFRREAKLQPSNVKVRTDLLTIARATDDTKLASEMTEELKGILGSNSPTVRRIEAEDIIMGVTKKELPKSELERARRLVDAIAAERPEWVAVPRLRGDIDRLNGDYDSAITNFQQALAMGENNPKVGRVLLALLTKQQRLDEMDKVLDWLRERGADEGLGKYATMSILNRDSTNVEEALPQFESAVKDSTDYRDFITLGTLRQKAGKLVEAEAAFREAIDLDETAPNAVVGLVRFLATTGRKPEAVQVIEQSRGKLPAEVATSTAAMCYEMIGDKDKAETLFLKAVDEASDKSQAREQLALFYQRSEDLDKLGNTIDQIIQAGADEDNERAMTSVRWARLVKAGIIASKNNYRTTGEALALIEQNKVNGELNVANKSVKARILAARADQQSRKEAIKLYEEVFRISNPSAIKRLPLAHLYELTGQWSQCRDVMFAAMSEEPNNERLIKQFIEMSLRHGEFADVKLFIDRLAELTPDAPYVKAAQGRLLVKQGDIVKGVALLKSLVPTKVTDDNANQLLGMADLLTKLQQYGEAEALYRGYVAQRPDKVQYLAQFLAIDPEGDLHEALDLAEKGLDVSVAARAAAIASALSALRNHRVDVEPADFQRVKSWIDKALADDPNSVANTLQLAELYDIQGNYDEAEAVYRKVIATEGVTDNEISVAENNLAYLLVITGRTGDEALPMIEDAILRLGPLSQLLDTRGMVYLALKQVDNALSDFQGAVIEDDTGTGYYHLALAQQADNDMRAAARSFDAAKKKGFRDTNLSRLERPQFDQLMQELSKG